MRRMRVYVAGPISKGDREANIKQAMDAGTKLLEAGYAPLIPHLTDFMEPGSTHGTERYEWWLETDLAWIETADAVLRLPGESVGADREVAHALKMGIPVFYDIDYVEGPLTAEEMGVLSVGQGDPRFHKLLRELGELHDRKQLDYGADEDPFHNIRATEDWGISPWIGALVRMSDKVRRLQRFAQRGSLANESAEDSMKDIAVYAMIALILYREESARRDAA